MIEVFLFGIILGLIPITIHGCVFAIQAWGSVGSLID